MSFERGHDNNDIEYNIEIKKKNLLIFFNLCNKL